MSGFLIYDSEDKIFYLCHVHYGYPSKTILDNNIIKTSVDSNGSSCADFDINKILKKVLLNDFSLLKEQVLDTCCI